MSMSYMNLCTPPRPPSLCTITRAWPLSHVTRLVREYLLQLCRCGVCHCYCAPSPHRLPVDGGTQGLGRSWEGCPPWRPILHKNCWCCTDPLTLSHQPSCFHHLPPPPFWICLCPPPLTVLWSPCSPVLTSVSGPLHPPCLPRCRYR